MRFFLVLMLSLSPLLLLAQKADSVVNKVEHRLDSIKLLELPDTLNLDLSKKAELALQAKKDSIELINTRLPQV